MSSDYADLRVYDPTGVTLLHTIAYGDYTDAGCSDDAGGTGGIQFTVPFAVLPSTSLLDDCVIKVARHHLDGTTVTEDYAYAVRGEADKNFTVHAEQMAVPGRSLLEVWGEDAVIRPEFAGADMPRQAGETRALSWAGSVYDPATDPDEPWDKCYATSRTTMPTDPPFPEGTGAAWISAADAELGDRKMFRSWLTIPAFMQIRVYFSGDEGAQVLVGGDLLIQTDFTEVGKVNTMKADRILEAGTYAVAVDTVTHVTKGGDGVDPILVAICELNDDGSDGTWLLVSNASQWVACRRPIVGPGSAPPGPTPGDILVAVAAEAADRGVETWSPMTLDFDGVEDSDGVPWTTKEERIARYGFDSYGALIAGLGDVACDVRITPNLVLQARVFEGEDRTSVELVAGNGEPGVGNVTSDREKITPAVGTVFDGYTVDGWLTRPEGVTSGRREKALSLGTAPSLSQGERILNQAVIEIGEDRLDGAVEFIAQPGCEPGLDFKVGDTITVRRRDDSTKQARVLSLAARLSRPIRWTAELGEAFL